MTSIVKTPDLGGTGSVIEIFIKEGQEIKEGDSILLAESEKSSMEVPSEKSGIIKKILVKKGDKVELGVELLEIEETAGASTASTPAAAEKKTEENKVEQKPQEPMKAKPSSKGEQYTSPMVRLLARKMGIDLTTIAGSGDRGRILPEDLLNVSGGKQATGGAGIPAINLPDFSTFGAINEVPFENLQKIVAENMHRNWLNVPHVTQFDQASVDELEAFRTSLKPESEKKGIKLTILPFIVKAVAITLRKHSKLNSSVDMARGKVIYKNYYNVGVAVDTPKGLLVPVIKEADRKSIWEIANEINTLAKKAIEGSLSVKEMQGGTFTVSSLGSLGGGFFTPIVNAPEVAILGVGKAIPSLEFENETLITKLKLPLSLSYDHRIVNGADGTKFMVDLVAALQDLRRFML